MHKFFTAILAIIALSTLTTGCGRHSSGDKTTADSVKHITVKQLLETPDSFLNRMFVVEGLCIHACNHLNHDAYLITPGDSDMILKIVPSSQMGGHFPQNLVDSTVMIKGIFREERVTEESLALKEEQYKVQKASLPVDSTEQLFLMCETSKRYYGNTPEATFPERIKEQREQIINRIAQEGKAYLSFYYLDATSIVK